MASNDYTELRAWLERKGAKRAGELGCVDDLGADFEAWVYQHYTFILVRAKTGSVTLFGRIGDKNTPVAAITSYLRNAFQVEDISRLAQKHRTTYKDACALAEANAPDVHYCDVGRGHLGEHYCNCGFSWSQVEGDNALLQSPADAKKKPERVRGFQI